MPQGDHIPVIPLGVHFLCYAVIASPAGIPICTHTTYLPLLIINLCAAMLFDLTWALAGIFVLPI